MIYENEELRLRTININAEVERGQSDIRKLRRENDQLRREIWALRDEYDRLDKLLRAHRNGRGSSRSISDYDDDGGEDDDGGGGGGEYDHDENGEGNSSQSDVIIK